ncbi:MAG: helix-turn-helix domain-containing protein [Mycobacterium sp.]
MGTTSFQDRVFRDNVRTERESRKLSLAQLAKLLQDKGLKVHTTTIAKIEYGERPAKLDEAVALADVFGVSLDSLIGRRSRTGDKSLPLNALAKRAHGTAVTIDALEAGLREYLNELREFTLARDEASAATECERACDALAEASAVVRKTEAKLARIQKRRLSDFLADDSHDGEENGE